MKLASITEAQLILFKKKVTPAEGERERYLNKKTEQETWWQKGKSFMQKK